MIQKYGLYERILNQKPRKTVEIYDSSVRDQVFMKVRNLIAGSLEKHLREVLAMVLPIKVVGCLS